MAQEEKGGEKRGLEEVRGTIFDIQHFSVHDGPGIRTTVFLKGCTLKCQWCANPEGISPEPELLFYPNRCKMIGRCTNACPASAINNGQIDRSKCTVCGVCAQACPEDALRVVGENVSAKEVVQRVAKDKPFYANSGGGITLSGGEPLAQADFAQAILFLCKSEGMGTCVETAGNVKWQSFEKVAGLVNIFLFDLKLMDPSRHRAVTGFENKLLLENAKRLVQNGEKVLFRMPLIPDVNMDDGNLECTSAFLLDIGKKEVVLLPYHGLGEEKYVGLGKELAYHGRRISKAELDKIVGYFTSRGIRPIVY